MAKKELPKMGTKITTDRFHISKMNVRWERPFGKSEEDQQLIANLRRGRVVQPFKCRPEGKGYGVVVGRRRFLAKKEVGAKHFVVGVDCLIEDMRNEEAREASLIENLEILRQVMDPVVRAKRLNEIISLSSGGLRATARRLGIKASTLSEWLKPLELSPKMQEALSKEHIFFTDALHVARMELGKELQDKLAEVAETEGLEAFKKELVRVSVPGRGRGQPRGVYIFLKPSFDKRYKPDMDIIGKLDKLADGKNMKRDEYAKWVIVEHVKSA